MKTLLYTVSDFKNGSLQCVDMMLESITSKDFDFAIISNRSQECKYKVYVDESHNEWVGFLKFSEKIPEGYGQYIYLDSDILYFGPHSDLFSEKELSIVLEQMTMDSLCSAGRKWFQYPHDHSQEYLNKISRLNGINSGTFAFKNISFLAKIRKYFEFYKTQDVLQNVLLEQSSFNYAVCQLTNFDFSKCLDLTNQTVLHAKPHSFCKEKKLYHFCGFTNSMDWKSLIMQDFLNKNKFNF